MSITAVGSTGFSQVSNIQRNYQQVRSEFKQLGQDLQTGNLTQAQADFVTLSQSVAAEFGSNSPVSKTLSAIGQALQAGNVGAAQQAFRSLPTALVGPCAEPGHAHLGAGHSKIQSALDQLGQALRSGNLATAQQAFAAVQQIWRQPSPTAVPAGGITGRANGLAIPAVGTTL